MVLRVGTDCSGIEAPLHALQQLGVPYEHVFSSEICPTVRKQLLANHAPQILYEDATARDNNSAPYVDLYVAGWPCQGNSLLGKRRGLSDPRTRVVRSLLEYVHLQGPKVVVLENVANALTIDGGAQFREVCASLEDSGYIVHWRVICPTNLGIPMRRRRLYIVGVRRDLADWQFAWPNHPGPPEARRERLLSIIGPATEGSRLVEPPLGLRGSRWQRDNWAVHSQKLRERGAQPDEAWICNLTESTRFARLLRDECPCLTRVGQDLWIFSHGRFLTTLERMLLQGFDGGLDVVVSDAQFRAMLGNSMCVDVLKLVLGAAMPALVPAPQQEAQQER